MTNQVYSIPLSLHKIAAWTEQHIDESNRNVTQVLIKKLETKDLMMGYRFQMLVDIACTNILIILRDKDVNIELKGEYIETTNNFKRIFSINNHQKWQAVHQEAVRNKCSVHFLGLCHALSDKLPSQTVSAEQIEFLSANINIIRNEIADNINNILLREYFLKELEFMSLCIKNFEFFGGAGLEDCTGKLLQKCISCREEINPTTWKKITGFTFKTLHLLALIGAASHGVNAISDGGQWALDEIKKLEKIEVPETKLIEDHSSSNSDETLET